VHAHVRILGAPGIAGIMVFLGLAFVFTGNRVASSAYQKRENSQCGYDPGNPLILHQDILP
jgi:hypothetical protein